jgi:hypothetical protein
VASPAACRSNITPPAAARNCARRDAFELATAPAEAQKERAMIDVERRQRGETPLKLKADPGPIGEAVSRAPANARYILNKLEV